jgi:hypothetical protein
MGRPPEYRRRSRVSHLSSGWNQSGSTTPCAPGKLSGGVHPEDCIERENCQVRQ